MEVLYAYIVNAHKMPEEILPFRVLLLYLEKWDKLPAIYYHALTHPNLLAGWDLVWAPLCSDIPNVHYIDDVLVVKLEAHLNGFACGHYQPPPVEVAAKPKQNSELCLPSRFSACLDRVIALNPPRSQTNKCFLLIKT